MLSPGTIVHERYRIEHLVGQGAMGAVYAAVDQRLGQTVALKHTLVPGPGGAAALDREAQILTRLAHPSLPAVSDAFAAAEGQCLVMTFVPGPTLAELLEQRGEPFESVTVLAWADQILAALAYLHGQQPPVLHRDLKPQNLKLTPEGRVVLLDFGLARGQLFQTQLAGRRSVVGYTLPYAPLEQVRGEDTDPRSDLFALAGTLYHLLTGAPPPDALERAAVMLAGRPDPLVPPEQAAPASDARLSAMLSTALNLDPGARPESAVMMRAALTGAMPPTPTARTLLPWPLIDGVVFALALLLVTASLTLWVVGPNRDLPAIGPTVTPFGPTEAPTTSPFPEPMITPTGAPGATPRADHGTLTIAPAPTQIHRVSAQGGKVAP